MAKKAQLLIEKWQRTIDDWPTDAIVPAGETLTCARERCGEFTWWAGKGQRTLGYCLTCIPGASFWTITPDHEVRVLQLLLATFPGSTITACEEDS